MNRTKLAGAILLAAAAIGAAAFSLHRSMAPPAAPAISAEQRDAAMKAMEGFTRRAPDAPAGR